MSPKKLHPALRTGMFAGFGMVVISLIVLLITESGWAYLWIWFVEIIVYYFAGRHAADQQSEIQSLTYEPSRGVIGAGVGSALVTSISMWLFRIIRAIVVQTTVDAIVFMQPFFFCSWVIVDVLIAIGLGALAGKSTLANREPFENF